MKEKRRILLFTALLILVLTACGGSTYSAEPPELKGEWIQTSRPSNFYQVARIVESRIAVYWHVVQDDSEYLYWYGTFVPPEDGKEPYTWVSENKVSARARRVYTRVRPEETLEFTYKDGKLSYTEIQGRIHMTVSLVKKDTLSEEGS